MHYDKTITQSTLESARIVDSITNWWTFLPELAEIFHISVDTLLNGKAPLVEAVLNDTVDEYMEEGNVTEQEIADTLPLLKPEQAEDILEKTDVSSFTDLSVFLPYMDEEAIGELAMAAIENGEDVSAFIPHINPEDVGEISMLALEKGFPVDDFLMYMHEEDVTKLALKALKLRKK